MRLLCSVLDGQIQMILSGDGLDVEGHFNLIWTSVSLLSRSPNSSPGLGVRGEPIGGLASD
jgi:hypothetical protein